MSRVNGRSFPAYVATPHFTTKWRPSTEFSACIRGKNFKTLAEFRRWARETFPTFYREVNLWSGKTGKETIDNMWGDFLRWRARP